MTHKLRLLCVFIFPLSPLIVEAEEADRTAGSTFSNLAVNLLPVLIIGLLLYFLLKRAQSTKNPRVKAFDEFRDRQIEHMQRVEEKLDRIAKLLEK